MPRDFISGMLLSTEAKCSPPHRYDPHRAGAFHLADTEWTKHPGGRDAEILRKVAGELPDGAVRSMSIFCRNPNPYPLGAGDVHAVPLAASAGLDAWV